MSTLKVNALRHTGASSDNISLDSSGNVSAAGDLTVTGSATLNGLAYPSAGPLSSRNLIVNGSMAVAQRGTSETGLTGNANGYPADRFRFFTGSLGTWTIEQSTDAPAGFGKSAKMTCTTGASADAGDYVFLEYSAEAQDLQQLDFGASTAEATTLSFYVKSNKTGTGSVEIEQLDNSSEQFVGTYTISSADTWELKTIAIPADTDGVINDDNGTGLRFRFWLNSGTDYSGGSTTTAWTTYGQTNSNISNLGVGGTDSDNWAITGVQLEVGEVATPFEHRSYGDELLRCQRYFLRLVDATTGADGGFLNCANYTSVNAYGALMFPTTMRTGPSLSYDSSNMQYFSKGASDTSITLALGGSSVTNCEFIISGISMTAGDAGWVRINSTGHVSFNAEL